METRGHIRVGDDKAESRPDLRGWKPIRFPLTTCVRVPTRLEGMETKILRFYLTSNIFVPTRLEGMETVSLSNHLLTCFGPDPT